MAYIRNCIENTHSQAVQSNIGHDTRTCVQNVHADDQPLVETSMESASRRLPYCQTIAVERMCQLQKFQRIINSDEYC